MDKTPYTLTVSATVARYGISRSRVYELIADGTLDARKVCGRTLIIASSVEALIAAAPRVGRAA